MPGLGADAVLIHARNLRLPAYGNGEVRFLAGVLERYRPTHVFDWGTNVGASARLFYEAAQILDYPCEVHTVELPDDQSHLDRDHPGHRYAQLLQDIPVHLHRGDGLETSIRLCVELNPPMPLFFLDGNHAHHAVLRELRTIHHEEPGAVMVVHDTVNLTGGAITDFQQEHPGAYRREEEKSDSGMVALWPSL